MQSLQTRKIPFRRKLRLGLNHFAYSLRHARFSTVVILFFLTVVALISLLPIVYVICNAFKPLEELFVYPPQFFVRNPTMQNFTDFMYAADVSTVPFSRYLFNSVSVTLVTTALAIVFSLCCAYAFSKLKFPGQKVLFQMITIALMFSPEAVVITRDLIVNSLHIIDTFWAHILPHLALPMGVFLIKQFMDQVPNSLCEAAKIDGANEIRILWSIITPAVLPAVGAVLIIAFQNVWGDMTTSTLYTVSESMKTLPYFVSSLTSGLTASSVARKGATAAAGLLMLLPNFIIFAVLQKSMIETMVTSGIK
ncbi:MAG: carbohydrate ABC transporter permease [Clostridia bacterium]|nr:carbohydrate ABC transporter permease [Clostridia bacterium]